MKFPSLSYFLPNVTGEYTLQQHKQQRHVDNLDPEGCRQGWQHAVTHAAGPCKPLLGVVHAWWSLMLTTKRGTGQQSSGPCMQLVSEMQPQQQLSVPCLHGGASLPHL